VPYSEERASRIGHVPTAQSPAIAEAMKRWEIPSLSTDDPAHITSRLAPLHDLPYDLRPDPLFTIAFDGSNQEVEARAGYPSVRVGYLQIAGVYLDINRFLHASRTGLVNARELEKAQITQTVNSVLPGSNVYLKQRTGIDTWRAEFTRAFTDAGITDFGTKFTLADALMTVHGAPGAPASAITIGKCPACGSAGMPEQTVTVSGGTCTEPLCGRQLHVTDLLRIYEEYAKDGENIRVLNLAMNIAERLLLIAYIDGFYRHSPARLSQGLFITDGPLALHGATAPVKSRFIRYWEQLCVRLVDLDIAPPLLVGIEKKGNFVDHSHAITEHIPNGNVMMLDSPYINEHIINAEPDHYYGKDEFYGRRFFYKTTTGEMLVVTVPRIPSGLPYEKPRQRADGSFSRQPSEDYASYPTLRPTLEALDRLQTRLYPNAVIPVALAHSACSLPLGTGRSVLTLLAQQSLGMPRDSISLSRFKPQKYGHRTTG
jgi:hypothetical protein